MFSTHQRRFRSGAGIVSALLLALCSCGRVSNDDRAVATVDGRPITVKAFRERMALRGGEATSVFASPTNKAALLDEMIRFEVLAARAEKDGYLNDPGLVRALKQLAVQKLEENALSQSEAELRVSDAEVDAYYRDHAADYRIPERIRAAMIHVSVPALASPEKKAERAVLAEKIREEALTLPAATRNFGYLAAKYSDDQATRYKGGDAGWLTKGGGAFRWDDHVVSAVFGLPEPGAISPVLEGSQGFYVFRLMERVPEKTVALDQVAQVIRQELARRKRAAVLDRLYAGSREVCPVRVDGDLLESVEPPEAPPSTADRPPPLPGE